MTLPKTRIGGVLGAVLFIIASETKIPHISRIKSIKKRSKEECLACTANQLAMFIFPIDGFDFVKFKGVQNAAAFCDCLY